MKATVDVLPYGGSDVEPVQVGHDLLGLDFVVVERRGRLLRPVSLLVDHLFRSFDEIRHPTDVALGEGDLESGHTLEVVAEEPREHGAGGPHCSEGQVGQTGRIRRDHRHGRRRPDVHADDGLGVLGRRHHRIPVPVRDHGSWEDRAVRGSPRRRRQSLPFRRIVRSPRGPDRVPQRDDDQRNESPGNGPAPFIDHPVVVGLDAQHGQILVLGLVEDLAAETGKRGEAQ